MFIMAKLAFIIRGSLTDAKLMGHLSRLMEDGYTFTTSQVTEKQGPLATPTVKNGEVQPTKLPTITGRSRGKLMRKFRSKKGTAAELVAAYLAERTTASTLQITRFLQSEGYAPNTGAATLGKMRMEKKIITDDQGEVMLNPDKKPTTT
jgi:hypothetical protein